MYDRKAIFGKSVRNIPFKNDDPTYVQRHSLVPPLKTHKNQKLSDRDNAVDKLLKSLEENSPDQDEKYRS